MLKVNSSVQVEITTLNAPMNKLGVKWSGGTLELNTLTLAMTNEAGQTLKIGDLKVGDYVNLTVSGSTPVSLQYIKQNTGVVSSVDAAAGSFVLKDYAGTSQTFAVSGGVKLSVTVSLRQVLAVLLQLTGWMSAKMLTDQRSSLY